jgi:PAS domain S-box-containing protein
MIDTRDLGAAPENFERDFDVAAPVRTHSRDPDARFGWRAILTQARSPVRPASRAKLGMEVTLSRKRAKTQTRGRKLHSTEAKARIARPRTTRAELEQELKACRREIANARKRLAEAAMQQAATSEMLRLISNSPIQSVLDKVAEHAARLCDASNARIWRLDDNRLRLAATYGESSATMDGREGLPADRDTVTGRAACDRRTIHVRDIAAEVSEYPLGSRIVKGQGWHTTLATPLLRDGTPIGVILVRRMEVRPFHDKQIALLETFAGQAAVAIENVRLFETEKQHTLALAHANRDLAERGAKIRRLVDSNIIGIFMPGLKGRVLEANDAFLHLVGYDRDDLVSGRVRWTDLTPPEWRERDRRALAELSSNTIAQPYEKEFFRKDGSRVSVLIGGALFEDGGNEGVAFVLDLTERKRLEERLRVQYTIAQILAEAAAIEEATPRILRAMGERLGWDVGALWRVDREAEALRCVELWHRASIEVPDFEGASREFTFGLGSGLPGRVWASLEPEYIPDVASDANFPRAPIAEREGLRAAFGFPIMLGREVLGVIEFFSREIRQPDQELLNMLATIGSQIGQFIERKRAEAALQESERSARSALDGIAGLVAIMTPNGEVETVNRQCVEYFGRPVEDQRDWVTTDMVHREDLPHMLENFKRAIASEIPYRFEQRLRRFDGEYRWFETRGGAVRDDTGNIVRWYVLLTDIEDRKRAEQALRRSEAYLAEAERLSHSGVSAYNETAILYGSEETYRIWGFDPAQGVPSREAVFQRIHPGDRAQLNAEVQRAVSGKRGYSAAYRIVLPDGTIKHLETIGRPAFSANGELIEIVTTQIDVTERKRAEEALRESEAKIRRLVDSNIIGIFIWDFDGRILEANDEFLRMVRYDRAELLAGGIWWSELTPPDWRDRNNARIERERPSGRFESFEKEFTRKDGSRVPILIGGATFEEGGNQGVAFVLDLTERRRVEAEAHENERRYREAQLELAHANRVATMGQLTASITHEVNQPITAAVTYALAARRWLNATPPNFNEVDDALSLIVKEGNRAGEVVGRIRALIKKAPARKDAIEINDTILEVVALTRTEAANNRVSVRMQLAEGLPPVLGDRVQLQQVLLNLIINAIEALRDVGMEERELLISSSNESDGVSVEVQDSGPGFAPEVLDRVFEAFYTTKPGGLGLGLSICRSILEAHNGRLWARPNVPRGAVFGFIAPVHPAGTS